jgi:flagellar hook-associated protein 3 FlgL
MWGFKIMRVTNGMMSNNLNRNINNNMRNISNVSGQLATGLRVQRPSDDPIATARILRFRSNLSRTEQYLDNVNQANDWMRITEEAIIEIENIVTNENGIMSILLGGSSANYSLNQLQMKTIQLTQLVAQMGAALNTEFGGRHIFSGFRTNYPPMFQTDRPNDSFNITQQFNPSDVQSGYSLVNRGMPDGIQTYPTDTVRLPYRGSENVTVTITNRDGTTQEFPAAGEEMERPAVGHVRVINTNDPNSFTPYPGEILFNPETGQLIFGEGVLDDAAGMSVNYDQHGFRRGEPNPAVFFDSTNLNTGRVYTMDTQSMNQLFGLSTTMPINTLGKNVFSANMFAELTGLIQFIEDIELVHIDDVREHFIEHGANQTPPWTPEEIEAEVERFMTEQENKAAVAGRTKFSNTLGAMEGHYQNISKERADLGARMTRLDSKMERLENDIMMYGEIIERNEAANVAALGTEMQALMTILQASLMVTSVVLGMSLVDFI